MDTEEKYMTSYELSDRNQNRGRFWEEITKMWLFLKGERAQVTFKGKKKTSLDQDYWGFC